MQKMQERRRFVRVAPSSIGVAYRLLGQEGKGMLQTAKDINQGGIRFPVSRRLPKGATLELELALHGEAAAIHAQAEVAWCARFSDGRPYEVGCQFVQIDPLDRGKIIRRIHETLKTRKPWA